MPKTPTDYKNARRLIQEMYVGLRKIGILIEMLGTGKCDFIDSLTKEQIRDVKKRYRDLRHQVNKTWVELKNLP